MPRKRRRRSALLAIYVRLLRLYPNAFRRRFAREILQVASDQLRAARRRDGRRAVAATWLRLFAELPHTICRQHVVTLTKETPMSLRVSKFLEYHLALIGALILAALLTPSDLLSTLLTALPLLASYACLRESAPLPVVWRWTAVAASLLPPAFFVALGAGWISLGIESIPSGGPVPWGLIALITLGPLVISLAITVVTLAAARRGRARPTAAT